MSQITQDKWDIESVVVNSDTEMKFEGFDQLSSVGEKISIEPAGIEFAVVGSKTGRLILDSCGQKFFATFSIQNKKFRLTLTRPKFAETIVINARIEDRLSSETVERELVQV